MLISGIIDYLEDTFPGQRFICSVADDIKNEKTFAYQLGNVHIYKTINDSECSIISTNITCHQLNNKIKVLGRLFMLLSFEDKINALEYIVNNNNDIDNDEDKLKIITIHNIICVDILQEFVNLYNSTNKFK